MRIDGITTCVGELYAGYLARSLPVWLDTLDSLTIVRNDDRDKSLASSRYNCAEFRLESGGGVFGPLRHGPLQRTVWTDAFTRNGASFNKGAALNEAIAVAKHTDWILAFDCDIIPPAYWRGIAEPCLEQGKLYGAARYQDGKHIDRHFYPRGYFQLWHVSDPHYDSARPFDDTLPDAGGYDTIFADQWHCGEWTELPIRLEHQGTKATHWCGPETTREQQREAIRVAGVRQKARRAGAQNG